MSETPHRQFVGDRKFLTTAIPTGKPAAATPTPTLSDVQGEGRRSRGAGGDTLPQPEHRFDVLCLDRKTGKILWQKTAKVAAPHEGYHRVYGSFGKNKSGSGLRFCDSFG
jgi:hypothetical protein